MVCRPKSCGVLNIKDFGLWNVAALMKQLWAIMFKKERLWIRWVHAYYIKAQNVSSVKLLIDCSWMLKKIFAQREVLARWGGNWHSVMKRDNFSIQLAYRKLVGPLNKVSWKGLVCGNGASPKAVFIAWMLAHQKVLTVDRLNAWGMELDPLCAMCKQEPETQEHLFLQCC